MTDATVTLWLAQGEGAPRIRIQMYRSPRLRPTVMSYRAEIRVRGDEWLRSPVHFATWREAGEYGAHIVRRWRAAVFCRVAASGYPATHRWDGEARRAFPLPEEADDLS